MMVNGVWYKVDEALPPPDYQYYNGCVSIEVAIVLKKGDIRRGFRYYTAVPNYWIIFDRKDREVKDSDIAYWTMIPI